MYSARAEKLRSVYFQTFYDPKTGVLAGWKSADGNLHDYYFTFVNGVAITYGLIPPDKANLIMDRMLAEMKKVGYTHFEYGLPGNLIPIRRGDYVDHDPRFGGPVKKTGRMDFKSMRTAGPRRAGPITPLKPYTNWAGVKMATRYCFLCLRALKREASRDLVPTA